MLLVAAPPAGVVLYALLAGLRRRVVRSGWTWVFGGYAAVLVAFGLLSGIAQQVVAPVVGAALLVAAAVVIAPRAREGVVAFALGGMLLLAGVPIESWVDGRAWRAYAPAEVRTVGVTLNGPMQRIVTSEGGPAASRSYLIAGAANYRVQLDLRAAPLRPRSARRAEERGPASITVEAAWPDDDADGRVQERLLVGDAWASTSFVVDASDVGAAPFLIVRLYLPPDVPVLVRDVVVVAASPNGSPPVSAVGEWRATLFYGSRNLLGHSAAVAALAVLAVARSSAGRLLGVAPFLALVATTGSRSAWLGLLIGGALIALARSSGSTLRERLMWWLVPIGSTVGLAIAWTMRASLLEGQTPRLEIFAAAWRAFLNNPWRGLSGRYADFGDYWQRAAPGGSDEVVTHAHNLWLAAAVDYGVLGMVATVWLTLGFLVVAWRLGGRVGLGLVVGALVMATMDVSFLFIGVQLPLLWGLHAMAAARAAPT